MSRVCLRPSLSEMPAGRRAAGAVHDRQDAGRGRRDQRAEAQVLGERHHEQMPKIETPAVITSESHISGSMPVLMASIGVYCRTAGGFLRSSPRPPWSAHLSGSTSAGHQFFGGSLKNNPHTAHDHQHVDADEVEDPT